MKKSLQDLKSSKRTRRRIKMKPVSLQLKITHLISLVFLYRTASKRALQSSMIPSIISQVDPKVSSE
jgi:hypothetical protein